MITLDCSFVGAAWPARRRDEELNAMASAHAAIFILSKVYNAFRVVQ